MSRYSKNLTVDIHDVDYNGIARASAVMRYIQGAAQAQLTDNNMSYDSLYKNGRAFIISRIRIEFQNEARAYDNLTATTFPCESRGYRFLRCYELNRGNENICRAVSVWALIDTDTRGLVRVNDFELGLATLPPLPLELSHFVMPKGLVKVGEYSVVYGITDQNMHMNNTAYPDMYSNFLPLQSKRIKSLSINYINEAPAGERLDVFSAVSDGIYYFRTVRQDGKVNSEAEIELADI